MNITTTVSLPQEVLEALRCFKEKFHINISHYVSSLIETDLKSRGELKSAND